MICNSCENEFTNIDGLKFCPYCGSKIEEEIDLEVELIPDKVIETGNISDADIKDKIHQDTLPMPVITKGDIRKYNRDKFLENFKRTFIRMKVFVPILALLLVIAGGALAYTYFIVKPVDEVRIRQDLMGKVVTFPKGTSIKINKDYIKSFSIDSRNTDKSKDEIKVTLTLNNGEIEANTLLSLVYTYEGKKQWKLNDFALSGITKLKPVVGMDQKKFLEGLKKLSTTVADTPIKLGGKDVKSLAISLRTPDLENGKEDILVTTAIDSGLLATTGKIKCKLIFENEVWSIASIEKNSNEDFKLVLSPTFSDERALEAIRKHGFEETLSYSSFFGGKGFKVKDSFTKSIKIVGKKFDEEKGTLSVTAKRENTAGEIKLALATYYTFSISFSEIALLNGAKTVIESGKINDITNSTIISTITNAEIEGSNQLFWWSNNHKITTEEAKSFKSNKILFKKSFENIKYVYGSINSVDGKNNKSVSFVALYFLVYDGTNGYNWKLNKLVGEDSPNYKTYSEESIN